MDQIIEKLKFDDLARIEDQRSWVRDHFIPEAREKYKDAKEKLRLLDAILKMNWIEPNETWKLQCLGITFGDILVQEIGLEWVVVMDETDNFARTPALKLEGTTLIIYPLTMISKRIERGDKVNVYKLLEQTIDLVNELKGKFSLE